MNFVYLISEFFIFYSKLSFRRLQRPNGEIRNVLRTILERNRYFSGSISNREVAVKDGGEMHTASVEKEVLSRKITQKKVSFRSFQLLDLCLCFEFLKCAFLASTQGNLTK